MANSNYNTQLGLVNGNMTNQQNLHNNNMSSAVNNYGNAMNQQQGYAQGANNAAISAYGTNMAAAQQAGNDEYEHNWGNWGNGLGIIGSFLKPFSDEQLKHYRTCSKKVVCRSPSKIQSLKFVKESK